VKLRSFLESSQFAKNALTSFAHNCCVERVVLMLALFGGSVSMCLATIRDRMRTLPTSI
jgi:hypothetical protein